VVSQFPGNTFTVEEVDGDPSGAVNKLVFSNGTVTIDGNTATVVSGGGAAGDSYHGRYDTQAETERAGATGNVEYYYTARPDGDGEAESETSDTGETDTINRTLAYSTKFRADPDTAADWVNYTTQPADNASFATAKAALLAGLNDTDATAETRGTLPLSLKMTRTTTAAATDLLLDTYTGAAVAYSVRKLDKDYTGSCMRIRRSSDEATQDIGFDSNGDLDTAAIASFVGDAYGYVTAWYDQSGNGNNATQSTANNQPMIYDRVAAAVFTENGKPIIKNTPVTSQQRNALDISSQSFTTDNWAFGVCLVDQSFSNWIQGPGGGDYVLLAQSGNGSSAHSGVSSVTLYKDGSSWSATTRGNVYTDLINNQSVVVANWSSNSWTSFSLGYPSADQIYLHPMQEFILWTSDQSSNRSGIETNQNNYFSVY
jgi:hypothetical protein